MADLTQGLDNDTVWLADAHYQGYSDFAKFLMSKDNKQPLSDFLARILDSVTLCDSSSVKEQNPKLNPAICYYFFTKNPADCRVILAFKDTETKMEWMLKYG
jgi:hypothetical protein